MKASGPDAAAAAAVFAGAGEVEARLTGTVVGEVFDGEVDGGLEALVVGRGQVALASPPKAASMPQIVTGGVTLVPDLPGVPVGIGVRLPGPVQTPVAVPSTSAITPQAVAGAYTSANVPDCVVVSGD